MRELEQRACSYLGRDPILHMDMLEALRRGEQSPGEDGERIFLEQAGKTRRLLEQVVELDRRTSVRMAGEQSFYHK